MNPVVGGITLCLCAVGLIMFVVFAAHMWSLYSYEQNYLKFIEEVRKLSIKNE